MSGPETEPMPDGGGRHRRWPQVENKVNSGQLLQVAALILSFGSVVIYQRAETEEIRKDAAVQKVQTDFISAAMVEDRARVQREIAEKQAALNGNLTKIEGKVDAVTAVVQQLSTQIAISQSLQGHTPASAGAARRP